MRFKTVTLLVYITELKVSIIANPKRNVEWTSTLCIEVFWSVII